MTVTVVIWLMLTVFQMEQKQVVPPFKPNISGEFGLDNFDAQFTNEPIQLTPDDEWVSVHVYLSVSRLKLSESDLRRH